MRGPLCFLLLAVSTPAAIAQCDPACGRQHVLARGLYDPDGTTSRPGGLPPPGSVCSGDSCDLGVDPKLGRTSHALAARVFYTLDDPVAAIDPKWRNDKLRDPAAREGFSHLPEGEAARAETFPAGCTRNNAMGYAQALYLDVYPAGGVIHGDDESGASDVMGDPEAEAPVFIFVHGGGFSAGYANNRGNLTDYAGAVMALGYHVVAIEYRRGWVPLAPDPCFGGRLNYLGLRTWLSCDLQKRTPFAADPGTGFHGGEGLPDKANAWFTRTVEWTGEPALAIGDCMDAWRWVDEHIRRILPNAVDRYILGGTSAGGAAVWQMAVAAGKHTGAFTESWKRLNRKVLLAIPSFGTYGRDFLTVRDLPGGDSLGRFPIVMQSGGQDQLVPLRDAPIYWQKRMRLVRGAFDIYRDLVEKGLTVVHCYGPIDDHGFRSWKIRGSIPVVIDVGAGNSWPEYLIYALSLAAAFDTASPGAAPVSHVLTRIDRRMGRRLHDCFGYPEPGDYTSLSAEAFADIYPSGLIRGTVPKGFLWHPADYNGRGIDDGPDRSNDFGRFWYADLGGPLEEPGFRFYDTRGSKTDIRRVSLWHQNEATSTGGSGPAGCPDFGRFNRMNYPSNFGSH